MSNTVNMQRNPTTQSMPGFNSQGQVSGQQYKPPMQGMPQQSYGAPTQPNQYGAPPQQPGQYGVPPQQPGMQGRQQPYGAPPQQYGAPSQPGQYGAPPPLNPSSQFSMVQSQPPMNSYNASPYASAPPPSYGGQQQQYGNPPLQQFSMQQPNVPPGAQGYVGSVSLQKGGNFSLSKANPNLVKVRIGLGWDVRQTGGPAFDLDASAFLLKSDGRVRMSQDLIFYNNKQSVDGSIFHHGDNLTGAGEGDDEVVSIDLTRVPPEIQKIVFTVSIYEAEVRQQNFGMVSRAFIRVVDDFTNQEICRFDLSEEASMMNTMIFGEVYRYGNEWKFRAVGQGIQGGLKAIGGMFGLNLQ